MVGRPDRPAQWPVRMAPSQARDCAGPWAPYLTRLGLLDQAWDEDGTYTDPLAEVTGRSALHAHIGASFSDFPGMVITRTSAVDVHHDKGRFTWQLELPDGSVPVGGTDFVEVTPQGQIRSIVGFFGPLAPKA